VVEGGHQCPLLSLVCIQLYLRLLAAVGVHGGGGEPADRVSRGKRVVGRV